MVGTVLDIVIGLSFVFGLTAVMVTATVEGVSAKANKRAKWLLRGLQQLFGETTDTPDKNTVLDKVRPGRVRAERETYATALQAVALAQTPAPGNAARDNTSADGTAGSTVPSIDPANQPPISLESMLVHPLLQVLTQRKPDGSATRLPSEIPTDLLARCLLDLLDPAGTTPLTPAELSQKLQTLVTDGKIDVGLAQALKAIIKTLPPNDAAQLKKAIEDWFKGQMKAVSEAYRRWTKRWAIAIGIGVAVFFNVSAVGIFHTLYTDQPTRDATVALATSGTLCANETEPPAEDTASEPADSDSNSDPADTADTADTAETKAASTPSEQCADKKLKELRAAGLPIGWNNLPKSWSQWWAWMKDFPQHVGDLFDQSSDYLRWLGWLLTGLAASFGAPFWFDALKRVSGLKKSVEGV